MIGTYHGIRGDFDPEWCRILLIVLPERDQSERVISLCDAFHFTIVIVVAVTPRLAKQMLGTLVLGDTSVYWQDFGRSEVLGVLGSEPLLFIFFFHFLTCHSMSFEKLCVG